MSKSKEGEGSFSDAEESLTEAKKSVQQAIEHLSEIVIKRCDGTNEWKPEDRERLSKSLADLLVVRQRWES